MLVCDQFQLYKLGKATILGPKKGDVRQRRNVLKGFWRECNIDVGVRTCATGTQTFVASQLQKTYGLSQSHVYSQVHNTSHAGHSN